MEDLDFRQRLLDYIENIASECLPQQVNWDPEWMDIDAEISWARLPGFLTNVELSSLETTTYYICFC